jgi:hypothetical protein
MVDYAATQVWAKGVTPSASREGCQNEAIAAKPLNTSSPPTVDGVDRPYRQLVETDAIAIVQLA